MKLEFSWTYFEGRKFISPMGIISRSQNIIENNIQRFGPMMSFVAVLFISDGNG